jgi:hypothetical protein
MAAHPDDPHIHVEAGLGSGATTRNVLASTFGLVGNLPTEVRTGCGRDSPLAMTSTTPENVTCLPCREHAAEQHLRLAGLVAELGPLPGSPVDASDVARAAAHHRALARRFS